MWTQTQTERAGEREEEGRRKPLLTSLTSSRTHSLHSTPLSSVLSAQFSPSLSFTLSQFLSVSSLSSQLSTLSSQLSALSSQLSALNSQLSALSSQLSALTLFVPLGATVSEFASPATQPSHPPSLTHSLTVTHLPPTRTPRRVRGNE